MHSQEEGIIFILHKWSINVSEHYFRILFHGVEFSKQLKESKDTIRTLWILTSKKSTHLRPRACAVANELKLSKTTLHCNGRFRCFV